ncbi:hypothetical protein Hypma_007660 [Hypsizygus marmoreus]|uniref:MYND-type domain-containing protein n=1 Tax=Hypsizygus marmoreus TaxID=39966 RepID=A0A369JX92_HYPMA|nr:hypothetical protein Hypma_007660 [Hypsizygus marmoreus]
MPDMKERCSYCNKLAGRQNLQTCSRCRMVRYCSKECQKKSWATHKKQCSSTLLESLAKDPDSAAFNARLSKWINYWRMALHNYSVCALDMAHHPEDRLETHVFSIWIEPRIGGSSPSQLFRFSHGKVMARAEVVQFLKDVETDPETIRDWENDKRGNDTVQIMVVADPMVRFLWFSMYDAAERRKKHDDDIVATLLAESWQDAMKELIESGDESRANSYLQAMTMRAIIGTETATSSRGPTVGRRR